ncbi:Na+/H+ antiporter [Ameyamaea chiangmaiensis NBRC 103196]|uniref:Na+/H+ antiporter n=1 Tax=Ameyamaea chiangmaiensis TaxID=442969 RepID=A0A850PAI0_9PROT|nr:Na+/H+ antiporter [Ameyamaea chiangmaiensis]MBS4073909.1 Na+/H+ antiporter [Ameyamaea chiangmaiensis]NVN41527.1 Na+/H+ antiporter [Ameyamaea chiangmaiensis]GBQ67974.1 Na+/H+ antiporter [Ameyamaea chiangmaiensis NBRC 103196]
MTDLARFELFLVIFAVILFLALLARCMRLPPSVAFIGGGLALAMVPGVPVFTIDPDLVLVVFLPPLLMAGAYFTVWPSFRANLSGILQLAVGAVLFCTLVVGVAVHWLVPSLPWAVCFALGAILAPPDAVAAKSVLERVHLPERLSTLIEGESLLNDASSLVVYRVAIAAFLTGSFSILHAVMSFAVLSAGGVALGLAMGWAMLTVLRRVSDSMVVICLTLLGPWVAYVVGERVGVSGVMATVTMGLLFGWYQHDVFSAATRLRGEAFWSTITFLLEAMIFVIIGLALRAILHGGESLFASTGQLALCVAFVVITAILARFAWVYGAVVLSGTTRRLAGRPTAPRAWAEATVTGWCGMRGVVSLAVALSTPEDMPGRSFVLLCTFALILTTVVGQGTTLGLVIRALKLSAGGAGGRALLSEDEARLCVATAQRRAIEARATAPDGRVVHPRLLEQYRHRETAEQRYLRERDTVQQDHNDHFETVLAIIAAGRSEILSLHRGGRIHDEVLRALEYQLDLQELTALAERA